MKSERNQVKKTLFCAAVSIVIFLVLFLVSFRTREDSLERQPVDIVVFGDSVFGETRDETAVPALLQEILGKDIFNGAFGGTCAARVAPAEGLSEARDMYSMAELAKSVYSGDFGVQQSIGMKGSNTEYFAEVVDGLEMIDYTQVGVFIIQQGINDYHAGVPIENEDAPYDEYTFLGALRQAVRYLRKTNPRAEIILLTPVYTWYPFCGQTCEDMDYGGGLLEDYVNAELRLAAELDLNIIDVYHDCFPHEEWDDWNKYSRDGLHPNEAGREVLVERISETLRRLD